MHTTYEEFLSSKARKVEAVGRGCGDLWAGLYPFQRDIVTWAIRRGRAAIFADCGLGKTVMQLEWIRNLMDSDSCGLIVAPLAVTQQTIAEARNRLGLVVLRAHEPDDVFEPGIYITNYERIDRFAGINWQALVLDESSILKSVDGKTRTRILNDWTSIPYRLSCTATPAPNDVTEMGNQAEFLGVASRVEMLAEFFVHDDEGWRLKGHAAESFWKWVASWAIFARRPSDIGHSDDGFELPRLIIRSEYVTSGLRNAPDELIPGATRLGGISSRIAARRGTLDKRVARAVEIVGSSKHQWVIWCGLNDEGREITRLLGDQAALIEGSHDETEKITRAATWLSGSKRVLVTKPKIFGFGMNWQHCSHMLFLGLGDSYEQYYQAIRRCWRFGQVQDVEAVMIVGDIEGDIVENLKRKEAAVADASNAVVGILRDTQIAGLSEIVEDRIVEVDHPDESGKNWRMMRGDCISRIAEIETGSVGLSVFSPPFASLYTYSDDDRDLGNSKDYDQFFSHFAYLIPELLRVTMPGRRVCVHVQQVATLKGVHGVIGWRDFRADVVRAFVAACLIYDGEVVIDKDPQAQAIRTKSKQLLFVQKNRDSAWLRPAMADYILCFRAPGDNPKPVICDITNDEWIEWARPIWYGIRESDTLQGHGARDDKDERHICPLQLGTIKRCIRLWSMPGDLVLDPFAGIGSTGVEAIESNRHFVGIELKGSYWRRAAENIRAVAAQGSLF